MSEIILALHYAKKTIGAAYYDQNKTSVFYFEDSSEDNDLLLASAMLEHTDPTTVIVSKGQDVNFLNVIAALCGRTYMETDINTTAYKDSKRPKEIETSDDADEHEFTLDKSEVIFVEKKKQSVQNVEAEDEPTSKRPKIDRGHFTENTQESDFDEDDMLAAEPTRALALLPSQTFQENNALKRVRKMFEIQCISEEERNMFVRFRVDSNNSCLVRALGALLLYLDAIRLGVETQPIFVKTPISAFKKFSVGRLIDIDSTTLRALDIMRPEIYKEIKYRPHMESHPKLTIFALCNRTRSAAGRQMLRRWFRYPTNDLNELRKRHSAVDYLCSEVNTGIAQYFYTNFKKIRNVRTILHRLEQSVMRIKDWGTLITSLKTMTEIGKFLKDREVKIELIEHLTESFSGEIDDMLVLLSTMIDIPRSLDENRVVLQFGIDSDLDMKKQALEAMQPFLIRQALVESENFGFNVSVEYSSTFKFMVLIKNSDYSSTHENIIQTLFISNGMTHVKTPLMVALDSTIGTYENEVLDRERGVALRLQDVIRENRAHVKGMLQAIALLDASLALALAAKQFGWIRPNLCDEPILYAEGAYHPILVLSSKRYVRNLIWSGDNYTRVKVFTGPNASGKSVYLKTVGTIAFLAHIGSFVPAEQADIGPIDRIMTRIYTVDNVLDGLSTFAHDVNQIASAVSRAGRESLVIIDEFGKGAVTEVGLSLLTSVLNYWIEKGIESCPHIFVSSHFHALAGLLTPNRDLLSFHSMNSSVSNGQLIFYYKVVDGVIAASHASIVAREMGISEDITDKSEQIYKKLCAGTPLVCIPHDGEAAEKNERLYAEMLEFWPIFDQCDFESEESVQKMLDAAKVMLADPENEENYENKSEEENDNHCTSKNDTEHQNDIDDEDEQNTNNSYSEPQSGVSGDENNQNTCKIKNQSDIDEEDNQNLIHPESIIKRTEDSDDDEIPTTQYSNNSLSPVFKPLSPLAKTQRIKFRLGTPRYSYDKMRLTANAQNFNLSELSSPVSHISFNSTINSSFSILKGKSGRNRAGCSVSFLADPNNNCDDSNSKKGGWDSLTELKKTDLSEEEEIISKKCHQQEQIQKSNRRDHEISNQEPQYDELIQMSEPIVYERDTMHKSATSEGSTMLNITEAEHFIYDNLHRQKRLEDVLKCDEISLSQKEEQKPNTSTQLMFSPQNKQTLKSTSHLVTQIRSPKPTTPSQQSPVTSQISQKATSSQLNLKIFESLSSVLRKNPHKNCDRYFSKVKSVLDGKLKVVSSGRSPCASQIHQSTTLISSLSNTKAQSASLQNEDTPIQKNERHETDSHIKKDVI